MMTSTLIRSDSPPTEARAGRAAGPGEPLVRLLEQLACVVRDLTDGQYAAKPVGVFTGSVGGHVRHCLDHVAALLAAVENGQLDYDRRTRGTTVETDRFAALHAIRTLSGLLETLTHHIVERRVVVSALLESDGEPTEFASSVGRELAYVLSHTIHHNALIGAMVKTLGGEPPARFGYAPATIRNMSVTSACAR